MLPRVVGSWTSASAAGGSANQRALLSRATTAELGFTPSPQNPTPHEASACTHAVPTSTCKDARPRSYSLSTDGWLFRRSVAFLLYSGSSRLYGVSASLRRSVRGAAGVNGASRPDLILDPHAQRLALAIGEPALPREPEGGAVVAALAALAVRLHAVETASVDCG